MTSAFSAFGSAAPSRVSLSLRHWQWRAAVVRGQGLVRPDREQLEASWACTCPRPSMPWCCAARKSRCRRWIDAPGLPLKKGRAQTMTHDYKRHGTTTLFAALNVLDGQVIGQCQQRHTHAEWLKFLRKIDRETPKEKTLHLLARLPPACTDMRCGIDSLAAKVQMTLTEDPFSRPRLRVPRPPRRPGEVAVERWRRHVHVDEAARARPLRLAAGRQPGASH